MYTSTKPERGIYKAVTSSVCKRARDIGCVQTKGVKATIVEGGALGHASKHTNFLRDRPSPRRLHQQLWSGTGDDSSLEFASIGERETRKKRILASGCKVSDGIAFKSVKRVTRIWIQSVKNNFGRALFCRQIHIPDKHCVPYIPFSLLCIKSHREFFWWCVRFCNIP